MAGCAFLFPGQASQAVGMGRDLYELSDAVRELFDEVDETVRSTFRSVTFDTLAR